MIFFSNSFIDFSGLELSNLFVLAFCLCILAWTGVMLKLRNWLAGLLSTEVGCSKWESYLRSLLGGFLSFARCRILVCCFWLLVVFINPQNQHQKKAPISSMKCTQMCMDEPHTQCPVKHSAIICTLAPHTDSCSFRTSLGVVHIHWDTEPL